MAGLTWKRKLANLIVGFMKLLPEPLRYAVARLLVESSDEIWQYCLRFHVAKDLRNSRFHAAHVHKAVRHARKRFADADF